MCIFKVLPSSSSEDTEDTDTDDTDSNNDLDIESIPSTSASAPAPATATASALVFASTSAGGSAQNQEGASAVGGGLVRKRVQNEGQGGDQEGNQNRGGDGEAGGVNDDLVEAIKAELNKPRDHPPDINSDDLTIDVSFHPSTNILATASVTGDVQLYKYQNHANELIRTLELHLKACRAIEFGLNGDVLYSCGKDKSIMITDTETGKLKKFYDKCHQYPLYSLYEFDENIICSGDENGTVKIWDVRQNNPVMSFTESDEYISDMVTTDAKKFLITSSGAGFLTAYNMAARKPIMQSEQYDAELHCVEVCKMDSKLVTGSSIGKMYFFNWGEFGYHSDVYLGVKGCINSMIAITENMVVIAYDDGNMRAYNLYPHRHIGIVGQHGASAERLDISHDGELIASCSLDQTVKFWNIKYFEDLHLNKGKSRKKKTLDNNLPSSNVTNTSDFFAGMA